MECLFCTDEVARTSDLPSFIGQEKILKNRFIKMKETSAAPRDISIKDAYYMLTGQLLKTDISKLYYLFDIKSPNNYDAIIGKYDISKTTVGTKPIIAGDNTTTTITTTSKHICTDECKNRTCKSNTYETRAPSTLMGSKKYNIAYCLM
jgi:hypothetical protein